MEKEQGRPSGEKKLYWALCHRRIVTTDQRCNSSDIVVICHLPQKWFVSSHQEWPALPESYPDHVSHVDVG